MAYNISIYFLVSILVFFTVSKISYKFNFVDFPNKRKKHSKPTAYTGGLALGLIYIFSIFFFNVKLHVLNIILSISFLIVIVGFIDDKYDLNMGGKLSLQIIPIAYLMISEKLILEQIGNYYFFSLDLNSFSIPFTLLCVLFLINSFNYFDGIDGLLGLLTISILCILYFLIGNNELKLFLILILLPIVCYIFFNFSLFGLPKLFLGDSGSLVLGFIVSFILIYLGSQKLVHPIILAWSISIFVYEFISINIIRLMDNRSLFKAGGDHLHNIILKKTKSIFQTDILITGANTLFFITGYFIYSSINSFASLILFIFVFNIYFLIRYKYK